MLLRLEATCLNPSAAPSRRALSMSQTGIKGGHVNLDDGMPDRSRAAS